MPEAMPARFTGTDPVSECDAGVPAKPTPMPTNPYARPTSQYDVPSSQSANIVRKPSSTKTYPENSVNRAPRASMSFADLGATRTMRKTAGRMDAAGLQRRVAEHVLQELLTDEHGGHERAEHDDAGARGDPEDAARRHVEVVQRIPGAALPDEERDPGGDRDRSEPDRDSPLVRDRGEVDRDDEGADEDGRHDAAEVVDRIARLVDVTRDEHDRQYEGDGGERQSHEEHGAPPELLQETAGDEGAERRQSAADRGPQRDRLRARRPRPQRCDEGQRRRVGHAGRDAAEDASEDEEAVGRRIRSRDGRRDRQRDPQDEHHLAPVAVSQRAEVQHRGGEAERVADGDEVQRGLRRVEGDADVGQRHVGNRQIQVGDCRDQDEREEDERAAFRRTGSLNGTRRPAGRFGPSHLVVQETEPARLFDGLGAGAHAQLSIRGDRLGLHRVA